VAFQELAVLLLKSLSFVVFLLVADVLANLVEV